MSQYDNEKKFALFKNDKGENPKRPDYRGTLTLGGVEYKLSAWIREDKKGGKYMNGSVELKTDAGGYAKPQQTAPQTHPLSDIPGKMTMNTPPAAPAAPWEQTEDIGF